MVPLNPPSLLFKAKYPVNSKQGINEHKIRVKCLVHTFLAELKTTNIKIQIIAIAKLNR